MNASLTTKKKLVQPEWTYADALKTCSGAFGVPGQIFFFFWVVDLINIKQNLQIQKAIKLARITNKFKKTPTFTLSLILELPLGVGAGASCPEATG